MAKAKNTTTNSKEEIKMRKYIVEAPDPKKGQKVSSGGIRENGKLTSQFKNPVPYEEPSLPPTVITQRTNTEIVCIKKGRDQRNEKLMYLIDLVWQNYGEPVFICVLNKVKNITIDKIEFLANQISQHISSSEPKIIDVEADEIETVYDDDKIIRFSNRKVI